jgi:Zn-dependent M28 family amino/carboxypeptidase
MLQPKQRKKMPLALKLLPVIAMCTVCGLFLSVDVADFNVDRVRHHIKTLASPEFEGRGPLTNGETKTIAYLTEAFKEIGLRPIPSWDGYAQAVPLASIDSRAQTPISFGSAVLEAKIDIAFKSNSPKPAVDFSQTPVVFVGFGISSEQWSWDDYANVDVKGKIVVMLVNDPGYYQDQLFRGKEMTYFGRFKYKFEEAQRHGARGALVIHNADAAGYGWSVAASNEHNYVIDGESPNGAPLDLHGWISEEGARKIFAASGKDFDEIKNKLIADPHAGATVDLSESALTTALTNQVERAASTNLCGILPGESLPDEFVMISAHWDHLGTEGTGQETKIFTGAIDNASGVAATLELAHFFSKKSPPRSVIFCSFTAEERGLLGAKYFSEHPPFLLSELKGMINLDSLNVGAVNKQIQLYGGDETGLGEMLRKSAKKLGREVVNDLHPERGYFYRSDHYPLVLKGVKALLFLDIGFSNPEYLAHHYHKPTDVFNENWTLAGLVNDLGLFAELVKELAAAPPVD